MASSSGAHTKRNIPYKDVKQHHNQLSKHFQVPAMSVNLNIFTFKFKFVISSFKCSPIVFSFWKLWICVDLTLQQEESDVLFTLIHIHVHLAREKRGNVGTSNMHECEWLRVSHWTWLVVSWQLWLISAIAQELFKDWKECLAHHTRTLLLAYTGMKWAACSAHLGNTSIYNTV